MAKTITTCKPGTPEQKEMWAKTMAKIHVGRVAKEKENEEFYKHLLENDPTTLPFRLYHGTDAKMIGLSKEDRELLFNVFRNVIDALWTLYEPLSDDDLVRGLHLNGEELSPEEKQKNYRIYFDTSIARRFKDGNELYTYGAFFLSNKLERAKTYAKLAAPGGELGRVAYSLISGAKIMGLEMGSLGKEFFTNAVTVLRYASIEPDPVVFAFDHLEVDKLRSEQGGEVDWLEGLEGNVELHYRYLGEVELDLEHASYVLDFDSLSDLRKDLKPY